MSITTNTSKKSLLNGRKLWFVLAVAAAIAAAAIIFSIMSIATAKESYWVLNQDVPARTPITADLLTEVTTSAGTTPPSALTFGEIANEEIYSLYSLKSGDVLTKSNTGELLPLTEGLPSDFVVASFTANPSMAAGGNVQRGDYIDIIALVNDTEVTGSGSTGASYVLQRVLVIDATVDLDTYSSESAESTTGETTTSGDGTVSSNTNEAAMRSGIPTMFTVGLSPENAAVLALATQYDLYIVLSSADSTADGIVPTNLPTIDAKSLWGQSRNAGEGTDNTFGQGGEVTKPSNPTTPKPEETQEPSSPQTDEPSTPEETGTPEDTGEQQEETQE